MSLGSGHDKLLASSSRSNPRAYIPPAILNELHHLDLTGRVALFESEVIGVGSYGDVLKSKCDLENRGEVAVAVKRLRFYLKEDIEAIFQKEVYVWSKLNHDNILALLGFAFDESTGFPVLVSEWMVNGSSLSYVKQNSSCDLIHLAAGIAEGLAYLHENNIVHSDIKPENIVVTNTGDARICDFGGSRIAASSKSVAKPSTGIRGTPRYLSYEIVAFPDQYSQHTKESDVWAFGMTIFALIAQEHPFALRGEAHVLKAITDREVPSFNFWTRRSSEEKAIFRSICNLCWEHDPKCRAVMSFVASSLRDSEQHRSALRPVDEDQLRTTTSMESTSSDISLIINNIGKIQLTDSDSIYGPLLTLSSKLETLCRSTESQSETYQYLHAAMWVSSSLTNVFVKDFKIDGKLDHLMCAIGDALTLITLRFTAMSRHNEGWITLRLLQQIIECCLFINQYSRKRFEDRKLGTGDGRKISEFISFFVTFKEALEFGTGIFPAFTSSRVVYTIDESVLRQRLNPSKTNTKGQQRCLLGTRVEVQAQMIEWALSTTGLNVLWLHGVAGSGKSTVTASVAEHFRGIYRLGAFLSFTRGASDPSSVVSTIAFKLALFDSTIGSLILAETNRDKDIVNASLSTQFEKLLLDPLTTAADAQQGPVIIIIDALDECGTPTTRKTFMQVFLRGLRRLPINFKFLITSRREQDIDRAFNSHLFNSAIVIELDYTSDLSRRDVRLFLTREIRNLIEEEDIPEDGLLERQLSIIGDTAAGLFVWASTTVKLVSEHDSPLEKLAEMASNVRSLNGLDQLYSTVLTNSGISWRDHTSKTRFQRVIGLILLSKAPLREDTIDAILGPSVGKCRATLSRLRSVIDYRPGEPLRLFHTSFSDYLLSSGHTEDWFIDVAAQKSFLATRCFEIMTEKLRFNICDLKSSFIRNGVVEDIGNRIESRISPHVSYACSYWAQHLCELPYGSALMQELSKFMYSHLLYWLEVMSLLKKVGTIGPTLLTTIKWIGNNEIEATAFLRDARRLVNIFALPISQSVPHIYLSMLPLTATESKVSAHYLHYTSSLVRVIRRGVKRHSSMLKLLEGHTNWVNSVGFSPDGSFIVSGSDDKTVRIWDTESGESTAGPFEVAIGCVYFVTFSPDGTRIVVGGDRGIAVLDVENGRVVVGPFGAKYFQSIAVSPNGKSIVSASHNEVNMWDLESGTIVGEPFIGQPDEVRCVAYSYDSRFIVLGTGSKDRSIYVWDVESRRLVHEPFFKHTKKVNSVSFSPDGGCVVSCSDDKSVRIWNVKGEVDSDYRPLILTGHKDPVTSVAYSFDGTRIVSGSWDNTIIVWDSQNGQLVAGPFRDNTGDASVLILSARNRTCVAFSPDGTRIVSGSNSRALRICDAESGKIDPEPMLFYDFEAVNFSADGSSIVSNYGTSWRVEDGMITSEGGGGRKWQTFAVTDGMQFGFKGTFEWDPFIGDARLPPGSWGYRIAISPNGNRFAFGSDGSIRIWDKKRDILVCEPFDGQGGEIRSLTFSPDGRHIASGSDNVRVWDAETGKLLLGPFSELTDPPVYTVTYSPDGRHIASGSYDKSVRVWDLKTGRSDVLEGHTAGVRSISFSPDGSHIVSSSWKNEIRVWSTTDSKAKDQDQLFASTNIDQSTWTLGRDGWIRGAHDELLLWIPPDLRPTLLRPRNITAFNIKFSTALDFSGSAQGEHWHKCFQPPFR